jgi:hypothetical protein
MKNTYKITIVKSQRKTSRGIIGLDERPVLK